MIQANGSLDVKRKEDKTNLPFINPSSFVKKVGEYRLITIEKYQFHRSNYLLYQLLSILENYQYAHFIKSTSVDGLAIYIQHDTSETIADQLYQEIEQNLQPEQMSCSEPQQIIRLRIPATLTRAQTIAGLRTQMAQHQRSFDILALTKQDEITCCIPLTDRMLFNRSMRAILQSLN